MSLQRIEINPIQIPVIADRYAIVRAYAERYIANGTEHGDTLRDAAEQTALDCKGIGMTAAEIKTLFRFYVRELCQLHRLN